MKCPLCGNKFDQAEMACHHGCPFNTACNIICCPNCGYEWVEESATVNLFRKIFGGKDKDDIREVGTSA